MLIQIIGFGLSVGLAASVYAATAGAEELLSSIERSDLSSSQNAALAAIESLPTSAEVKTVKVNTVLLRDSQNLSISLFGYSTKLTGRDVEVKDKSFRWIGQVSE